MKTRATLALAAVAGLASMVQAQEQFTITYSWNEVLAGTTNAPGVTNSVVDPGEGARIRLLMSAQINGSTAIGQVVNLTTPITNSSGTFTNGTVRGIGSFVYDLVGDLGAASANGTWSNGLGAPFPFNSGGSAGTSQSGGSVLSAIAGSQFTAPGGSVNSLNSVQAVRSVWTPNSYTARTVNFLGRGSLNLPQSLQGTPNAMLIAFHINVDDPENPFDDLVGKYVAASFGAGINIPIVPAPSSVALLGLGALVAGRRNRRR